MLYVSQRRDVMDQTIMADTDNLAIYVHMHYRLSATTELKCYTRTGDHLRDPIATIHVRQCKDQTDITVELHHQTNTAYTRMQFIGQHGPQIARFMCEIMERTA